MEPHKADPPKSLQHVQHKLQQQVEQALVAPPVPEVQRSPIDIDRLLHETQGKHHSETKMQHKRKLDVPVKEELMKPERPSKKRRKIRRQPFDGVLTFERKITLEEIHQSIRQEKEKKKKDLQFQHVNVQEKKKKTNKVWKSFYTWYDESCTQWFDEFLYPRHLLKKALDQRLPPTFTLQDLKSLGDLLTLELTQSDIQLSKKRRQTLQNQIVESNIFYQSYLDFTQCSSESQFIDAKAKWMSYLADPVATELQKSTKEEIKKKLNKCKWKTPATLRSTPTGTPSSSIRI
jgi:hypothetical protein